MQNPGQTHHIPASTYYQTFLGLLVLMIATVAVSYLPHGPLSIPIALLIAVGKALLVILNFMGVKFGTRLTWLWATIGFVWLILMFGITLDYMARGWIDLPQWQG